MSTKLGVTWVLWVMSAIIGFTALPAQATEFGSDEIKTKVEKFLNESPIIQELKDNNITNDHIRADQGNYDFGIKEFDLIACFHLTNPDSKMDVEGGGGLVIQMTDVQFAKGKYRAQLEFQESSQINMLEKDSFQVPRSFEIGELTLGTPKERIEIIKMMTQACKIKFPDYNPG